MSALRVVRPARKHEPVFTFLSPRIRYPPLIVQSKCSEAMMKTDSPSPEPNASRLVPKKPWAEPAIVLERSLIARAQGEPDGLPPFLGPLQASGAGVCV